MHKGCVCVTVPVNMLVNPCWVYSLMADQLTNALMELVSWAGRTSAVQGSHRFHLLPLKARWQRLWGCWSLVIQPLEADGRPSSVRLLLLWQQFRLWRNLKCSWNSVCTLFKSISTWLEMCIHHVSPPGRVTFTRCPPLLKNLEEYFAALLQDYCTSLAA